MGERLFRQLSPFLDRYGIGLALGAVLLASLWLRLESAWFAYPLIIHPDEPTLVNKALKIYKTHDFNPHFFNYPSLVIYLQSATSAGLVFLGSLLYGANLGVIPLVDFHVAGRIVAAVASVASIFVTFLIGRRLSGGYAGVFAAALVGVSPLHILNSALVTTDIWVAIFSTFVLYYCVKISDDRSLKNYLLAGIFVGLAVGSKYTAVSFFCAVVVSHFISARAGIRSLLDVRLFVSGLLVVVVFLATTPYALLDFKTFIAHVLSEGAHYRIGHPGNEAVGNHSYGLYLAELFSFDGLGWAGGTLALLGASALLNRRCQALAGVLVLPVVLFLLIGSYKVCFARNIVGAIPALSIAASCFLFAMLGQYPGIKNNRKMSAVFYSVVLLLVFVPLSLRAFADLTERLLPDTRWLALGWIGENLPKGSVIASEAYAPPVADLHKRYSNVFLGYSGLLAGAGKLDSKVDYVILSSRLYGRYFSAGGQPLAEYENQAAVYQQFFTANKLVYQLDPVPGVSSGPTIKIYENSLSH